MSEFQYILRSIGKYAIFLSGCALWGLSTVYLLVTACLTSSKIRFFLGIILAILGISCLLGLKPYIEFYLYWGGTREIRGQSPDNSKGANKIQRTTNEACRSKLYIDEWIYNSAANENRSIWLKPVFFFIGLYVFFKNNNDLTI